MFHAGHMYCHFCPGNLLPFVYQGNRWATSWKENSPLPGLPKDSKWRPPQMDRGLYHNPLNCRSISTGKKPLTPRPILWCPYFWTHHCNGNSDVLQTMGIRFFSQRKPWTQFFFHREKTISWSNRETSEPSAITSQTKEKTGRWPTPTVITWFINPILIKDNCVSAINPSYWSYVHQLSHCSGGPALWKIHVPCNVPATPPAPSDDDFCGSLEKMPSWLSWVACWTMWIPVSRWFTTHVYVCKHVYIYIYNIPHTRSIYI